MKIRLSVLLLSALVLFSCTSKPKLSISKQAWGKADQKEVSLYTLTNANGMVVKISNYGGTVTSIMAPDSKGKFENIVLGFDSLVTYQKGCPYFGALIGRYGNRIAKGKFTLDGKEYTLVTNNGVNHLHGGTKGFDKVVWDATEITGKDSIGLALTYVSNDMEEGYPGTLTSKVTYILTNTNELQIYYEAKTDKATVINLTHHSYFNLSGLKENVLNHEITLPAGKPGHQDHLKRLFTGREQEQEGAQTEVGHADRAHHADRYQRVEAGQETARNRQDHHAGR